MNDISRSMESYSTDGKVTILSRGANVNEKLAAILGPKFRRYRQNWDAAGRFELETEFPLFLQLELHQKCNLTCPYCAHGALGAAYKEPGRLSRETCERLILEGAEYGCPSFSPQGIEEPFLSPDLESLISFANRHGYLDIMLNTNGTLLDAERSQKLLDSGLTRLRFSLDAVTKETFEKCRRGASYERVMKNIDDFLALREKGNYRLPLVGVSFVVTRVNEHEKGAFLELWKDKVDMVNFIEFAPPETRGDFSEFEASFSHWRDDMASGFRCSQPWLRLYVHNTGVVAPCCMMFSHELPVGHIERQPLYGIWNDRRMKALRRLHKEGGYDKEAVCLSCVCALLKNRGHSLETLSRQDSPNIKTSEL